ncbi:MAG: hypothetical protein Ct9H300mP11_28850 [Chloroflexota bacterium]|nr:MAG: hypothetical protein Ct9H300mP11_28850 [Chloroflexota bacterium]
MAISAAITTDEIEEKVSGSGLVVGHSHSNDPMPCNAAIASIDIIMEEILVDVSQRIGEYWRDIWNGWQRSTILLEISEDEGCCRG